MVIENEKHTETLEADTVGGWLIHHFTTTWDTREPLAAIDTVVANAQAEVNAATAKLVAAQAQKLQFQAEIDAALAAVDTAPILLTPDAVKP